MLLFDVNVLLATLRSDHVHHAKCRAFVETAYSTETSVGMAPQALSGVIRIATQAKIMGGIASTLADCYSFSNALLRHPKTVVIQPGLQHWQIFEQLSVQVSAAGKLIPDAYFAALAIEHRCTWVTLDTDFAKFPRLACQVL
jgi:uncharacterized protein